MMKIIVQTSKKVFALIPLSLRYFSSLVSPPPPNLLSFTGSTGCSGCVPVRHPVTGKITNFCSNEDLWNATVPSVSHPSASAWHVATVDIDMANSSDFKTCDNDFACENLGGLFYYLSLSQPCLYSSFLLIAARSNEQFAAVLALFSSSPSPHIVAAVFLSRIQSQGNFPQSGRPCIPIRFCHLVSSNEDLWNSTTTSVMPLSGEEPVWRMAVVDIAVGAAVGEYKVLTFVPTRLPLCIP
ncbi:hypothetical protein SprV_0401697600 [Sparganum proliferum]